MTDNNAGVKGPIKDIRTDLQLEREYKTIGIALEMSDLQNILTPAEDEEEEEKKRLVRDSMRKVKVLDEQVQYLERRLETGRQEAAIKMSSAERLFGNENGKLKAREKDLRRKLQREKEATKHQAEKILTLAAELRRANDDLSRTTASHGGWMKHVRLPTRGDWPAIKLDTQQNKKALRHIFQQVEKEGGPPVNLDPSLFLHCVILFLWWKREATVLMLQESVPPNSSAGQSNSEIEELRRLNTALQQRAKVLQDTLGDCRAERQTFEGTMSTNLNQLLTDKYDLMNKVARLEDTVSALHLDNNLLRADLNDQSTSRQTKQQLQGLTDELQARLQSSEAELRKTHLSKEQMAMKLRGASKRVQTLEQDATIKDAVCGEHAERLTSTDLRRAELEKMTSELQASVSSLQHDLKSTEESRTILGKERDSFLDQLTKALDQLEDAKDRIREQNYQIKQRSDEYAQSTKTLKHQDEVIRNLQRDLTNHRDARGKLVEEKEKRRSLEISSANHERLVRDMEERMRTEEVDSATLLAELCGAQTEERSRLEGRLAALESERDEMEDAIDTLSNDKATLQADKQRLKLNLERVSTKLHTIIKRQALRVFKPPSTAAAGIPWNPADAAATSTYPLARRSSPVGRERSEEPRDGRVGDLEELIDLLVAIRGTSFARLTLGGVDGDASAEDAKDEAQRWEELARTEIGETDDEDEERDDESAGQLPSGKRGTVQRVVVAKLRALTLMMHARQKLRGKVSVNGEPLKARGYRDAFTESPKVQDRNETSDSDSHDLVDEPLITKQEQRLLLGPVVPSGFGALALDERIRPAVGESNKLLQETGSEGKDQPLPTEAGTAHSSEDEMEQEDDQSSCQSENEDLLSTLERERERLKLELTEIKEKEARVEEDLEREQDAHLLSLRRVSEYQEECVRMQLEKEELLQEPHPRDLSSDDDATGGRDGLTVELQRKFLEEMESLSEANEMLIRESLHQAILDDQIGFETNLQELETRMPSPSQPKMRIELPLHRDVMTTQSLVIKDRGEGFESSRHDLKTQIATPHQEENYDSVTIPPLTLQHISSKLTEEEVMKSDPEENEAGRAISLKNRDADIIQMRSLSERSNLKSSIRQCQGGGSTRCSLDGSGKVGRELLTSNTGVLHHLVGSDAELYTGHPTENKSNESVFSVPPDSLLSFSIPHHRSKFQHQVENALITKSEDPIHQQTLINRKQVPIRDALKSLEQAEANRPSLDEGHSIKGANRSTSVNRVTVALFSEPGDQPEEDQGQENHISEDKLFVNERSRRHGDRNSEEIGTKPVNQTGAQSSQIQDGSRARSPNMLTDVGAIENSRSIVKEQKKGHPQKQRRVDGAGVSGGTSWENAKDLEEASNEFRQSARSAKQFNNHSEKTVPNGKKDEVRDPPKIKIYDSDNVGQPTIDLAKLGNEAATSQKNDPAEGNIRSVVPKSEQKCLRDNQTPKQKEEHVLNRSPREIRRGSQDLHDTLTEMRLQKASDDLQAKTVLLQTSLDESAELVAALQMDKVFLVNCYTATQEDKQRLQTDHSKISKLNVKLQQELISSKKQVELLNEEQETLEKRPASETEGIAKMQRQIAKFKQVGSEIVSKRATIGGENEIGHQNQVKLGVQRQSINDSTDDKTKAETVSSEFRVVLSSLKQENTELRCRLNETKVAEHELQTEVDELRERLESLQSRLQESIELNAEFENNDLAAKEENSSHRRDRQRLEVNLETAQKEIQTLGKNVKLLESANERLRTRQASSIEKHVELQEEIELLRRGRLGTPSQLRNEEYLETSVEQRKFKQKEVNLKRQLEEQIDKTFDLENHLDDCQASIKELERERNILQDDFTGALQLRSQLKAQLDTKTDQCQSLTKNLEDSQEQAKSLKRELEGYLEQDMKVKDEEVHLLKKNLREIRIERQHLTRELADVKLRAKNLEAICEIHSRRQKLDEAERTNLEIEMEKLLTKKRETNKHEKTKNELTGDLRFHSEGAQALASFRGRGLMPVAEEGTDRITSEKSVGSKGETRKFALDSEQDEDTHADWKNDAHFCFDLQDSDNSQTRLKSAYVHITASSDRLKTLEETLFSSVKTLQEGLRAQADNISRLRDSTEGTLCQAMDKIKEISEEGRQNVTSLTGKGMALRLREDHQVTDGKRLEEARKLLERSIAEQRKQAASIAMLQQTVEKAFLQYGALKIRLRQQKDKMSGALASWERERRSFKKQLGETNRSLKLIEGNITSESKQSQRTPELEMGAEHKMDQPVSQEALWTRMKNCPCQKQHNEGSTNHKNQLNIPHRPAASTRSDETLTYFSRDKQDHQETNMEETQPQNGTDDHKKLQETLSMLSNLEARRSVDKITVQSLTDDNRRLRAMVYKLRERITADQISHRKDSRMDAIYQALARAQVRVIATSMADGSQTLLTGADAFRNATRTGLASSRLASRHHMGSVGNSLDESYD